MRVYKYRGGNHERDLSTLAENKMWLASLKELNDPFEARVKVLGDTFKIGQLLSGLAAIEYNDKVKGSEDKLIEEIGSLEAASKEWGIYSLSKSYKDELLWSYYSDSHRGFCIEYDLDLLLAYKLKDSMVIEVEYTREIPVVTIEDMFTFEHDRRALVKKLVGTKSIRWKHESEIRIVSVLTGLIEFDFRAVKAVYFGYSA